MTPPIASRGVDQAYMSGGLLAPAGLCAQLDVLVREYNIHKHRSLDGRTPLEAWAADEAPIEKVSEEAIAIALLRRSPGIVLKDGVRFNKVKYWDPAITNRVGDKVTIGWLETHPEFIEIFEAESEDEDAPEPDYICRALPVSTASKAFRNRLYEARKRQIHVINQLSRKAEQLSAERAAAALANLPSPPPADELLEAADHPKRPSRHVAKPKTKQDPFMEDRVRAAAVLWDTTPDNKD